MTTHFNKPTAFLADMDAKNIGLLIASAGDIAVVVGSDGTIKDIASHIDSPGINFRKWRNKHIEDIVTVECRPKVRNILTESRAGKEVSSREINHPRSKGSDLPIRYNARSVGSDGDVILIGNDLTPLATMQEQLITLQQSLEKKYEIQRQKEARYRMLFQLASEAFLIVDAESGQIREANPTAKSLIRFSPSHVVRRTLTSVFSKSDGSAIRAAMAQVLSQGSSSTITAKLSLSSEPVEVVISLFRALDTASFLVRLLSVEPRAGHETIDESLVDLMEQASETVVLVDEDGTIEWVNSAFVDITQCGVAARAVGRSIVDFMQGPEISLSVILANAKRHGRLRLLSGEIVSSTGQTNEVEFSVVNLTDTDTPKFGFIIRNVSLRSSSGNGQTLGIPQSTEDLVALIGNVPLKQLVRDATDMIERNCIEAALNLTGGNRALTAKVLGLSRQSLYMKLHKYQLDGDGGE